MPRPSWQRPNSTPLVEAFLALSAGSCDKDGKDRTDAFAPHLHPALRIALIPTIDSTKTVGLIRLPGAMTGLILAGVSPLTWAIRYQIVVIYTLLAAAALAALTAARLAGHAPFDDAYRLRSLPAPPERDHR